MKPKWRQRTFDFLLSGLLAILSPREFLKRKQEEEQDKKHQDMFALWQTDKITFAENYRNLPTKERGKFWRWLHTKRSESRLASNIRKDINQLIDELHERTFTSRRNRFN